MLKAGGPGALIGNSNEQQGNHARKGMNADLESVQ
jgi:hypothetical protein